MTISRILIGFNSLVQSTIQYTLLSKRSLHHFIRCQKEISFYFLKKESEIIIFVPKPSFLSVYLCYNRSYRSFYIIIRLPL